MQNPINNFDWARAFQNQNCSKQCKVLPEIFMKIFCNFLPHKTKKFDYKTPERINKSTVNKSMLPFKKGSKLTKKDHMNRTVSNK